MIAGAVAAAGRPSFGVLHGALAGLVTALVGALIEGIARTTSGCIPLLMAVEGRPCGRLPSVDYIGAFLSTSLTLGVAGAAVAAAGVVAVRRVLPRRRTAATPCPGP